MAPVFGSAGNITHTDDSRVVWSNTRRPALLLPENAVTLTNFDIAYPDLAKSNAYGFCWSDTGFQQSACASFVSVDPQEWDSGLSFVCDLPALSNYFEVELSISRIVTPSTWLGTNAPVPALLGGGQHMPDGNAALIEGIGPLARMFAFERVGNAVYLRRKQSVTDAGPQVPWNPNNNNTNPGGTGYRGGWTYGGNPNAWPVYMIQSKSGGNIAKRRGESNSCSLADPTNYASIWRGTVTITPGYLKP